MELIVLIEPSSSLTVIHPHLSQLIVLGQSQRCSENLAVCLRQMLIDVDQISCVTEFLARPKNFRPNFSICKTDDHGCRLRFFRFG